MTRGRSSGPISYQEEREAPSPFRGRDESDPPLTRYSVYAILSRMKQKKAYQYRFYPSEEHKCILAQTFGCCRYVYN